MAHAAYPSWFNDLSLLDESGRQIVSEKTLEKISETNPKGAKFVKDFQCELIGFVPRVEIRGFESEPQDMKFDDPALLYWCKDGKFGVVIGIERSELEAGLKPVKVELDDPVLWYIQQENFDSDKLKQNYEKAFTLINNSKRDTAAFIRTYRPDFLGFVPRIEYTMVTDDLTDVNTVWIHPFSLPTLLFWSHQGGFAFFVNANLDHNESVLAKVAGNRLNPLRGFTG